MNNEDKKHRFILTLLFSSIIFLVSLVSITFASYLYFVLRFWGFVSAFSANLNNSLLFIAAASLIIGLIISATIGKIPLKPVNRIINQLNHLASGDFSVRLDFGKPVAKHPTFVALSNSFNTLAEELQNTEMLRSDFINNFSHEFKTPIVSIAGFAKLINKGNLSEQQKEEYLKIIEEESMRLSYMATNVLNLTKVENQTILTDVSRYNLSEQLRSCILLFENKWTKKNIDLRLEFDEYYINANEELLKQVWINLIDNALKFVPIDGYVEISISEDETHISVSIINSGSKISPENMQKIFNKFYQADESHSSEGNGIGLAIVKRITELHEGKISVSSNDEHTSFTIDLPKK